MDQNFFGDPSAVYVAWYAAYLSGSAEEGERIWGWIGTPPEESGTADTWLRARIAALRDETAMARKLAEEAKKGYISHATEEFDFAFELDHIGRLVAGLPKDEAATPENSG